MFWNLLCCTNSWTRYSVRRIAVRHYESDLYRVPCAGYDLDSKLIQYGFVIIPLRINTLTLLITGADKDSKEIRPTLNVSLVLIHQSRTIKPTINRGPGRALQTPAHVGMRLYSAPCF